MPAGISTASLTLQQYAAQSNEPLVQRVVFSLLEVGSVLNDISFQTNGSLKANGSRIVGALPTVGYRRLNEDTTTASGTAQPFQEQAYIMSNTIDIDRLLMMDVNQIGDPSAVQVDMWLKAASYDYTDKFFNNNHTSGDPKMVIGIRQRLDDPTTWGTNTACKINAGGVDLSDSGLTSANANVAIRYMEQMLDEIGAPDGNDVVIYMNRNLRRRFQQAIRSLGAGGGFDMTTDAFGRRLLTFRNAVIRAVGTKADQSTEIITNTETSAGANGSSTYSSIYAVRYGDSALNGWQMEPIRIQNLGLRQDVPTQNRVFIEWASGLYQVHTRAVARVYGIKVA
jgi:hypothetical protein